MIACPFREVSHFADRPQFHGDVGIRSRSKKFSNYEPVDGRVARKDHRSCRIQGCAHRVKETIFRRRLPGSFLFGATCVRAIDTVSLHRVPFGWGVTVLAAIKAANQINAVGLALIRRKLL